VALVGLDPRLVVLLEDGYTRRELVHRPIEGAASGVAASPPNWRS
jgi:hypothetical protein